MSKIRIVDPHIHFFDLQSGKYEWLRPENPPYWPDKAKICRDVGFDDLVLQEFELTGLVHIEAGYNNELPSQELSWLEKMQSERKISDVFTPKLRSIAGINLLQTRVKFLQTLETCLSFESCIGIRHIFDDNAANLLNNNEVLHNFQTLNQYSTACERLVFELQMGFLCDQSTIIQLYQLIKNCDQTLFVVNHAGFVPVQNEHEQNIWEHNISLLSQLPNVHIKCSGLEMMTRDYSHQTLQNTIEKLLEIYGTKRVMMASNFPLVNFATSYTSHWGRAVEITRNLTSDYCDVLAENAYASYQFDSLTQ